MRDSVYEIIIISVLFTGALGRLLWTFPLSQKSQGTDHRECRWYEFYNTLIIEYHKLAICWPDSQKTLKSKSNLMSLQSVGVCCTSFNPHCEHWFPVAYNSMINQIWRVLFPLSDNVGNCYWKPFCWVFCTFLWPIVPALIKKSIVISTLTLIYIEFCMCTVFPALFWRLHCSKLPFDLGDVY